MSTSSLKYIFFFTMGVLFIPFLAMQFSNEVNWSLFDFVVMGVLVFSAGVVFQFVMRKVSDKFRMPLLIILALVVLLLWTELAVGVFGSPLAGS